MGRLEVKFFADWKILKRLARAWRRVRRRYFRPPPSFFGWNRLDGIKIDDATSRRRQTSTRGLPLHWVTPTIAVLSATADLTVGCPAARKLSRCCDYEWERRDAWNYLSSSSTVVRYYALPPSAATRYGTSRNWDDS